MRQPLQILFALLVMDSPLVANCEGTDAFPVVPGQATTIDVVPVGLFHYYDNQHTKDVLMPTGSPLIAVRPGEGFGQWPDLCKDWPASGVGWDKVPSIGLQAPSPIFGPIQLPAALAQAYGCVALVTDQYMRRYVAASITSAVAGATLTDPQALKTLVDRALEEKIALLEQRIEKLEARLREKEIVDTKPVTPTKK
jgi:hypothetical protein